MQPTTFLSEKNNVKIVCMYVFVHVCSTYSKHFKYFKLQVLNLFKILCLVSPSRKHSRSAEILTWRQAAQL